MGIRFACHACQKTLNIKSELAGKRGVCPQCGTRFRIPSDESAISSPVEADAAPVPRAVESTAVPKAVQVAAAAPVATISPVVPARSVAPARQVASAGPNGTKEPLSLLDDPTAVWYVRPPSGGQYGPATGDVLRAWIAEARVTPTSLIWRDGWSQWRTASEALSEFGATSAPVVAPVKNAVRPAVGEATSAVTPVLQGDATIGMQKSKRSNRRFVIVGTLAAICMTLIGVLILLIKK